MARRINLDTLKPVNLEDIKNFINVIRALEHYTGHSSYTEFSTTGNKIHIYLNTDVAADLKILKNPKKEIFRGFVLKKISEKIRNKIVEKDRKERERIKNAFRLKKEREAKRFQELEIYERLKEKYG